VPSSEMGQMVRSLDFHRFQVQVRWSFTIKSLLFWHFFPLDLMPHLYAGGSLTSGSLASAAPSASGGSGSNSSVSSPHAERSMALAFLVALVSTSLSILWLEYSLICAAVNPSTAWKIKSVVHEHVATKTFQKLSVYLNNIWHRVGLPL